MNFELGTRFNFFGITGEFVGYYNDYSNLLGSDLAATGGSGSLDLFNAGAATVKGIEFLVNYDVLRNSTGSMTLPITFSYTLTDTRFDSDFESDDSIYGQVSKGDQIPYIPKISSILQLLLREKDLMLVLAEDIPVHFGPRQVWERYLMSLRSEATSSLMLLRRYFYTPRITFFVNAMNIFDRLMKWREHHAGLRPGAPFMINGGVGYSF